MFFISFYVLTGIITAISIDRKERGITNLKWYGIVLCWWFMLILGAIFYKQTEGSLDEVNKED